ncbi:hypothetical protein [Streptomyces anulatus]|uniref:hypothetical protein n=1 Tax=Streptomyces anulatus TaxID=1892 RepID=UPI0036D0513F
MAQTRYKLVCSVQPGRTWISASTAMTIDDYVAAIGSPQLVVDMLVGALQRLLVYPELGFTVGQEIPDSVEVAYWRLRQAGFTSRLLEVK